MPARGGLRLWLRQMLPSGPRRRLYALVARLNRWPPVGRIDFGDLRDLEPINRNWGFDRGQPIDRVYVQRFLAAHSGDIRGRVLEIGSNTYTRRFGADRVIRSEVLDLEPGPGVTLVADLNDATSIASRSFDCVILTQTLQFIYDIHGTVGTLYRILKPAGVLLLTVSGISKMSSDERDRWESQWSFSASSAMKLLQEFFPPESVTIAVHGNVLAAIAFLHGIAAEELRDHELDYVDPEYQVLIGARAQKPASD